jgi:ankyrin repeat protein
VKLVETLMALPGVSAIRGVFGCSVHRAVEKSDLKTLRRLLLMGAGLGSVSHPSGTDDGGGWRVLHFAAAAGDIEILEYLLERDGDKNINMQDYSGFTALHLAVHRGHYDCTRFLLMKGANHAVLAAGGLSALHVAIARGDTTMLQILSQKNLDFASPTASATIISIACTSYTTAVHGAAVLSFLLNGDARSQLLSRDYSNGMCALAVAARGGDPALFARLIDAGASCSTLSFDGRDVVSHAAGSASGNASVIMSILHSIGVSFIRPSVFGKRPLHYIAEFAAVTDISLFLRLPGVSAYINDPDLSGFTPFLCAVRRGRVDACSLLQLQGAITSSTTDANENCLHIACANGHAELVLWLLSVVPTDFIFAKATEALPDCISAAAHAQSCVILNSLLQRQVRPPPGWDVVPLKLASSSGNASLMQMLMDAGASVERSGELLLAACAKHGHVAVAELLLKHANPVYLQANWSPAMSPLCQSIMSAAPPPSRPALAHAILDCASAWDSSDTQRILLHIEPSTGLAALPLAIIYGHIDIANRIIDLDACHSSANYASPVLSRAYANGLNAACLAAGAGQPELLARILASSRCDLSVVCAAVGRGMFLDVRFPTIGGLSTKTSAAYDQVLQIALSASETSRLDLNEVWNGRQPMWFACRTGNLAAAHALMTASVTVKPALTTEVKFKLDLNRHHTPLQAAAAGGNEAVLSWLLTYVSYCSNYESHLTNTLQIP